MTVVVVEDETPDEPTTEVVPVVVDVEVSEDHDVDFAERITRLEMTINDKADRSELTYIHERLGNVESRLATDEAVTEVVAEAVVDVLEQQETVEETPTETAPKEDSAPKSKRHPWWGKGKE